jgi:hypothetical protein
MARLDVTIMIVWGRFRDWRLLVVAVIAVATAGLLIAIYRSAYVAALAGSIASVVALAAAGISWILNKRTSLPDQVAADQDLDRVADLLAYAVKEQWTREAGERGLLEPKPIPVTWGSSSRALAGPVTAAAGSQTFAPLPGLTSAGEARLAAGKITEDLHAVYGGLGSGRLVIAGPWGAGKSGAGVLLVLAALKYRECDKFSNQDRWKIPVPVLFTGQDWDPRSQPVSVWLTGRMQESYPLFAGKTGAANAAALIAAGKIALILDGLDEVAEELRPKALQALSQQARFRLVLLSRTDEMASAAAQGGMLQGAAAIELRPIDAATAADYLRRVQRDPPPDGWSDLIGRIRASRESPLTKALNSPLTLTLVRDTYQTGDDARELLDFCDRISPDKATEEITGHLLDRVLPAAYAPRPGQPPTRYDLQTAQNALTKIAAQMNQDRDLEWWRLPAWAPARPRATVSGLVAGLVVGLGIGLVFGRWGGLVFGLGAGVATGLAAGLMIGAASGSVDGTPRRVGKLRIEEVFELGDDDSGFFQTIFWWVIIGAFAGLVPGLVFGLGAGLAGGYGAGVAGGAVGGAVAGLAGWTALALATGLVYPEDTSTPSPVVSWRNDRKCALQLGLVGGLVVGLVSVPIVASVALFGNGGGFRLALWLALAFGPTAGLVGGLLGALVAGLANSQVWPSSLAAAQLAIRWHTPVRLMRFLDDAHERNILRTVGPVYQFRHASLQDRLARTNDDGPNDSSTPGGLAHANNMPADES